jgi:hypothetical protein
MFAVSKPRKRMRRNLCHSLASPNSGATHVWRLRIGYCEDSVPMGNRTAVAIKPRPQLLPVFEMTLWRKRRGSVPRLLSSQEHAIAFHSPTCGPDTHLVAGGHHGMRGPRNPGLALAS